MKIENIDTTLEEIQEVGEQMRVINKAISQPVGGFQVRGRMSEREGMSVGGSEGQSGREWHGVRGHQPACRGLPGKREIGKE